MNVLLQTKIQKPIIPCQMVKRERLFKDLDHVLDLPLTLVVAPAGYGKTSLVVDWLTTRPEHCLWYSIDRLDNDLTRFLSYLISGLQSVHSEAVVDLLEMLTIPNPVDPQAVLSVWIKTLEDLEMPLLLVLDDYHLISDDAIHQALNFLVEYLPRNAHLIICSREEPPLPVAKYRAKQRMVELRTNQLRFNELECKQLMSFVLDGKRSEETLDLMFRQTEGWVTGLLLAAMALNEKSLPEGFIRDFNGGSQFVFDYLFEEVLNHCSEEKRTFLFQTAFLQRLNSDLCDQVLNRTNSQEMLITLNRENLFLMPLDAQLKWFRYHYLFAELLKTKALESYPGMDKKIHQKAATWFLNHDEIELALYHAAEAQDWAFYARVINELGMEKLYTGEVGILANWLNKIPESIIKQDIWLLTQQSWVFLLQGEAAACQTNLVTIQSIISNQSPDQQFDLVLGHMNAILAYLYAFQQNPALSLSHAELALNYLPLNSLAIRSVVAFTQGANAIMTTDFEQAVIAFSQAGEWGQHNNLHIAVPAMGALGGLLFQKGQINKAEKTYQTLLNWTTRVDGTFSPLASRGLNGLMDIYLEGLDIDKALEAAALSVKLAERWRLPDALMGSFLHLAEAYLAAGQNEKAGELIKKSQGLLNQVNLSPGFEEYFQQLQIQVLINQQNLNGAISQSLMAAESLAFPIQLLQVRLWLACIHVFQQRSDLNSRAKAMSDQLEYFAKKHQLFGIQIQVGVYQVVNRFLAQEKTELLPELAKLAQMTETYGFKASLMKPGKILIRILQQFPINQLPQFWQIRVQENVNENTKPELMDPLSPREFEILTLISSGKTNQEIAADLVIAVSTVKSHTNKIYAKLEVKNRTQALAKAKILGIII